MNGLGSFKGTMAPSSMGLGSFSTQAPSSVGSISPGMPSLNPRTGTTSFRQMYEERLGVAPAPVESPYTPPDMRKNQLNSLDDIKRYYKQLNRYENSIGEFTRGPASWETGGFASGGLVSLGRAYQMGGAVEPQAEPHSPAVAPQASSPDASSDPETEKLYMGAMMALDPNFPMSDEERQMILETFVQEFGEEELSELEAEMTAKESDGTSDSVPAVINGKTPAALSEGEFVMPADVVSGLGNGSTDAGARRLMEMIEQVRAGSAQNVNRPIGPSPLPARGMR